MSEIQYRELIEIEAKPEGGLKLIVSGNHAVDLLTFLQGKGVHAAGQDAPLFGRGDFPTIYYISFSLEVEKFKAEIVNYLKSKAILYAENNEKPTSFTFVLKS